MKIIERSLLVFFTVCCVSLFLVSVMPVVHAAAASIVWEKPQVYYDSNHAVPDDDAWVEYKLLRSGDTSGSTSVTFSVADATIDIGNGDGKYELLAANPIVFGPGSTYAVVRVRFHMANHDLFGTQHLTFRLSDTDADIEDDQVTRTVYVDYTAMPVLAFAAVPVGGYRAVEGQKQALVLNITKSGDPLVDVRADLFASGTAIFGQDYTLADESGSFVNIPDTIRLPPGKSVYSLHMTLLKNANNESNETVTFTIGNLINAAAGDPASVSVTITETGTATPVPPAATPVSTPTLRPTPTPAGAPGTPSGTTQVPLPSPGFEAGVWIVLVAFVVMYLGWRSK